jgi:hypothetical protein
MGRILVMLLVVACSGTAGNAWSVDPSAEESDWAAFHLAFASATHFYPRHGAGQLGVTGFDLFADLSASEDFDSGGAVKNALSGDLPAGVFSVARVGLRKGLPGRVNLGLAYGATVDGDIGLWSGEVQWTMIDGGLVRPSVALRLTASQSEGSDTYEMESYGLDLYLSKGIGPVLAYGGIGLVDSSGSIRRGSGTAFATDETVTVYFAGATLDMLIPKFTLALEKGDAMQAAVRIGFGW